MKIIRRTFEAKKHPSGSEKRAELNCNWITSEYSPSKRYGLVDDNGDNMFVYFTSKHDAQDYVNELTRIITYV